MTTLSGKLLRLVSYCGLMLSIVPAFLVWQGALAKSTYLSLMVVGMLLWFGAAVFWIKPDHSEE